MKHSIYPKEFFEKLEPIDPNLCFIVSPIKEEFKGIKKVIESVAKELGFNPVRADDIRTPGNIIADIWNYIKKAAVIIVDVTGFNPNVFFELGVACSFKDKSRLIIIWQPTEGEKYPFDIAPFRYIEYDQSKAEGTVKLMKDLKSALKTIRREDDAIIPVLDKMREWMQNEYEYDFLLKRSELKHLKRLPWVDSLDNDMLAYAFASSLLHNCDCGFWNDLNKGNNRAVEILVNLMCGKYRRPRYRAAFALQSLNKEIREKCLKGVEERAGNDKELLELVQSVRLSKVKEFVVKEAGKSISSTVAEDVLESYKYWNK